MNSDKEEFICHALYIFIAKVTLSLWFIVRQTNLAFPFCAAVAFYLFIFRQISISLTASIANPSLDLLAPMNRRAVSLFSLGRLRFVDRWNYAMLSGPQAWQCSRTLAYTDRPLVNALRIISCSSIRPVRVCCSFQSNRLSVLVVVTFIAARRTMHEPWAI